MHRLVRRWPWGLHRSVFMCFCNLNKVELRLYNWLWLTRLSKPVQPPALCSKGFLHSRAFDWMFLKLHIYLIVLFVTMCSWCSPNSFGWKLHIVWKVHTTATILLFNLFYFQLLNISIEFLLFLLICWILQCWFQGNPIVKYLITV